MAVRPIEELQITDYFGPNKPIKKSRQTRTRSFKRRKLNNGSAVNSENIHFHLNELIEIRQDAQTKLSSLTFTKPSHVYNPLHFAWKPHQAYLKLVTIPRNPLNTQNDCEGKIMFLGMNPGCHGMIQSGVPFGDVDTVKKWMQITDDIDIPPHSEQNPKKPIVGLSYSRKSIGGRRLYQWAQTLFEDTSALTFYSRCFVTNYCPLCFMDNSRNLIPEKLNKANRAKLYKVCDELLCRTIDLMRPKWIVGIGVFAEKRAQKIVPELKRRNMYSDFKIARILHPSPANPSARNFHELATEQFQVVLDSLQA